MCRFTLKIYSMKKYVIVLFVLACYFMSLRAMNLKEAFDALSNLPNVSTVAEDAVSVSINKSMRVDGIMQIARAANLDRERIKTTGNATFAILNQIPLSYMINGGNNGYVAAFVYSTPNESGVNDVLIVTMSGEQGDLTYLYVTGVDENSKLIIQEAELTMQGASLSIIPRQANGFIGAIKVNCD